MMIPQTVRQLKERKTADLLTIPVGIFSNRVYHIGTKITIPNFQFAYVRTTYHSRCHRRRSCRVSIEGFNCDHLQDRVTELIDCGTNSTPR